ncbi:MAG TPA: hypothetical protein VM802_16745 [Chitinophaga sp.]|uniref:hypothetical protein n=1 Tax=Chitinophaga sp. TaxID=1869181 RepID=UPI002D0CEC9F|nr:hypothetical protein [Chitinophaga sp.]HVI46527.1 hypothetical protein [Chitinophaga sp.]
MGYIKEPKGIDFVVDPKPLTENDRKMISETIAYYRATGRKKRIAVRKHTAGTVKKEKVKH